MGHELLSVTGERGMRFQRLWEAIQDACLVGDQFSVYRYDYLLDGKWLSTIADVIVEELVQRRVDSTIVAGPAMGADPLVAAIILNAHSRNILVRGIIYRTESKHHGTAKQIEAAEMLAEHKNVVLVDDVLETGTTLYRTACALTNAGYNITAIATVFRITGMQQHNLTERFGVDCMFSLFEDDDFGYGAEYPYGYPYGST